MLGIEELFELEQDLRPALIENLEQILIHLNRTDRLLDFLDLLGMKSLLGDSFDDERTKDGKIIVIGHSEVPSDKLLSVSKKHGFPKDRFEFLLEYEDAKRYNFGKTQWSPNYSLIMVGPMPHSGVAKEGFGSIISALETKEGYPPVLQMGMKSLKISKSSFEDALVRAVDQGLVA